MEHYGSGEPVLADAVTVKILDLLDDRIRPCHRGCYGGEVLFKKFADSTLTLELIGGGGAQKRDMMTNIISHHVPEIEAVTWVGRRRRRKSQTGSSTVMMSLPRDRKPKL